MDWTTFSHRPPPRADTAAHSCGHCADGWICEDHPEQPMGHAGCDGAGMPCDNAACGFSIATTGLVCPSCRQALGTIELEASRVTRFRCVCGYDWWTDHRSRPKAV